MVECLYAPEGRIIMSDALVAAAQAVLIELMVERPEHRRALARGYDLLAGWEVVDAETARIASGSTPAVYRVQAEVCSCPAYVKPLAAGDPPRFCYHRGGLLVLRRALTRMRRAEAPTVPVPDYVPGLRLAPGVAYKIADIRALRARVDALKTRGRA